MEVTIKPAQLTVESTTADNKTYDGTANAAVSGVTFSGLVTVDGQQEALAIGDDYTVSDATFEDKNVGTNKKVTATITLISAKAKNYTFAADGTAKNTITETKDTSAEITAFDISSTEVELADYTLIYTGTALEPTVNSVTVKLDGTIDTPLVKDTDYEVTYSNNTNFGNATVTIKGKGNFEGTKSANFTINKKSLAGAFITIDPSTMVYTGKKLEPEITLVTVDGIMVPSDAYTLEVSVEKQADDQVLSFTFCA